VGNILADSPSNKVDGYRSGRYSTDKISKRQLPNGLRPKSVFPLFDELGAHRTNRYFGLAIVGNNGFFTIDMKPHIARFTANYQKQQRNAQSKRQRSDQNPCSAPAVLDQHITQERNDDKPTDRSTGDQNRHSGSALAIKPTSYNHTRGSW
jgi:hypothetical protein